jgi:hypothetical protein
VTVDQLPKNAIIVENVEITQQLSVDNGNYSLKNESLPENDADEENLNDSQKLTTDDVYLENSEENNNQKRKLDDEKDQ